MQNKTINPRLLIFTTGVFATCCQIFFIREYLSIFQGNELVIGLILTVWMGAIGFGSFFGSKHPSTNIYLLMVLLVAGMALGSVALRAARLLYNPGQVFPPSLIIIILLITKTQAAFLCGSVFGVLSRGSTKSKSIYGFESAGNVAGGLVAYVCALYYTTNIMLPVLAALSFVVIVYNKYRVLFVLIVCAALLYLSDRYTSKWKYPSPISRIIYGREGEIAVMANNNDTTILINGVLRRSTLGKPFTEQAVHVPMAQRQNIKKVLVIFDRQYSPELALYRDLSVDWLESDKPLAPAGSIICSPEVYRPSMRYDMVLLGASLPRTMAENRFFTVSFFRHMQTLLTDSGVYAFTLPFSENYMSSSENKLYKVIFVTLQRVFKQVWIFPGNGYTFMASNVPLPRSMSPLVPTQYLQQYILPGVSQERLKKANAAPVLSYVNTSDRPVALVLALQHWAEQYEKSLFIIAALFVLLGIVAVLIFPKTADTLSIGSSGFAGAAASIAYLLLYQATCGALYSHLSLFLIALTAGFACGSLCKRLPMDDLIIGVYILLTILLLVILPNPSQWLFFLVNIGLGFLCGAQFVVRQKDNTGVNYAADMLGGVFGMALCSTLLIPLFGAVMVAIGLCGLKCGVWGINMARRIKKS